ncbi:chromate transporter [Aureimonas endophytica]|uniref:Chromate transporter n=1 Tax=Aureimonas endophytica TaxID=2027858 RepID=A0A916ZI08_9HYPH|nr:chromate efflux transporter [Aureimonas endophytica]GGD97395.1 chromate transporter [Aureimonas endophytica]
MRGKAISTGATAPAPAPAPAAAVGFGEALRVWIRIACLSFGGPAGQIALMHRILVDEKRWIDEARFLHALNFCMLLPGPEAQQLATYIGWLLHGTKGGLAAGILFVLPGAVSILALSLVYVAYGDAGLVAGLFFGLKAAVLAVVLEAVQRISRRALRNGAMRAIAAFAFVAIFLLHVPFPAIVFGAALVGWLGGRLDHPAFAPGGAEAPAGPDIAQARAGSLEAFRLGAILLLVWLLPVAALLALLGPGDTFTAIGLFFSKMAVVSFGGAYAVLAYVAQQAVEHYGWLRPGEMLNGLGLAETTPGPLIMVTQFVGFLAAFRDPGGLNPYLAGILGSLLTTWVTFAPCFLWIFLGAPFVERLRGNRALAAALAAITAAIVGVILNLAVWFGLHVLFRELRVARLGPFALDLPVPGSLDPAALLLALAAGLALFRFKLGVVPVLVGCAAAGALRVLLAG